MQYSPKLKKVASEIDKILKENDVAGVVFLHTPEHGEYIMNLTTSYSCAKIENGAIRVKAKLQEDFNGDKSKWEEKVRNTSNMLSIISEMGNGLMYTINVLSKKIDGIVNAEHTDRGFTDNTTQNN